MRLPIAGEFLVAGLGHAAQRVVSMAGRTAPGGGTGRRRGRRTAPTVRSVTGRPFGLSPRGRRDPRLTPRRGDPADARHSRRERPRTGPRPQRSPTAARARRCRDRRRRTTTFRTVQPRAGRVRTRTHTLKCVADPAANNQPSVPTPGPALTPGLGLRARSDGFQAARAAIAARGEPAHPDGFAGCITRPPTHPKPLRATPSRTVLRRAGR